jgi:uncharacterized protein YijF (DUF1287 family)
VSRDKSIAPVSTPAPPPATLPDSIPEPELTFFQLLANAAEKQTLAPVTYDPSYERLAYPAGDVPADRGVCADVIVRAYRTLGIDLQVLVHEDMKTDFDSYPKNWGLNRPDANIDHRRVLNLRQFFKRQNASLDVSQSAVDYLPGDVVSWNLSDGRPHIGLVSNAKSQSSDCYLVVHNIGQGTVLEDVLFAWTITGRYRYEQRMGTAIDPVFREEQLLPS